MFSIVIVYNNPDIENSPSLRSLSTQNKKFQLILINNIKNNNYSSAAAALNAGATKAACDFIIFMHQDIDLLDDTFLEKAEFLVSNIANLGAAGIAGISQQGNSPKERQRNIIYHGVPRRVWGNPIAQPEQVQTLDECLIIVPRNVFNQFKFDEHTCNHWHLYGVDLCLTLAEKNLHIYALPLPVYHHSAGESAKPISIYFKGSLSGDYFKAFEAVRKKHRHSIDAIYTSCASYKTNQSIFFQRSVDFFKRLFKILGVMI